MKTPKITGKNRNQIGRFNIGTSGNPEGRPKGSLSITSAIRKRLEEENPESKQSYLNDLVDVMIKKAVKEGDFRIIKEVWNHIDGSPRQTIEEIGKTALPIPVLSYLEKERLDELLGKS